MPLGEHSRALAGSGRCVSVEYVRVEVDPTRPAQGPCHVVDRHHGEVRVFAYARQVADEYRAEVEVSDQTIREPHSQPMLTEVLDVDDSG